MTSPDKLMSTQGPQRIGCYHKGCTLGLCYRLIDEAAAKKAYDSFAGPRGRRSTKEKLRDALAVYEHYRNNSGAGLDHGCGHGVEQHARLTNVPLPRGDQGVQVSTAAALTRLREALEACLSELGVCNHQLGRSTLSAAERAAHEALACNEYSAKS